MIFSLCQVSPIETLNGVCRTASTDRVWDTLQNQCRNIGQRLTAYLPVKYLALLFLVLQNTSLVLQMKASLRPSAERYMASTAVLVMELVKLVFSTTLLYFEKRHHHALPLHPTASPSTLRQIMQQHVFTSQYDLLAMLVPAALYAFQNNLLFLALTHLDAAVFQVSYQLKIISTALFMVLLLGKELNKKQWFAICCLMLGVGIVQLQSMAETHKVPPPQASPASALLQGPLGDASSSSSLRLFTPASSEGIVEEALAKRHRSAFEAPPAPKALEITEKAHRETRPMLGLFAVLLACLSSGFAGAFFEKVLKRSDSSLWGRNVQLGLFSVVFAAFACLVSDGHMIVRGGFFKGYHFSTWLIIVNQAIGGILVAIVVKYADNLLKSFSSCTTLLFMFLCLHI